MCPRVLVETNTSDISVGLGPLAPNGGPLQGSTDLNVSLKTLALTPTSPAIDAVLGACPAADERGTSRPQDGDNSGSIVCDIGAFELVPCLTVDKTCAIVPPPAPLSCSQPFKTLQMQWLPGSMKTGQNTQYPVANPASVWVLTNPGQSIDLVAWSGTVAGNNSTGCRSPSTGVRPPSASAASIPATSSR